MNQRNTTLPGCLRSPGYSLPVPRYSSAFKRPRVFAQATSLNRKLRLGVECTAASYAHLDNGAPAWSYTSILKKGPSRQAPLPPPPLSATLGDVLPYLLRLALAEKELWWRVGLAFMCLLVSKAAGLMCPLMVKKAVDSLSATAALPVAATLAAATQFILLYGLCDMTKHIAKELQAPLFTPVSQAAARRVTYHTFAHVLNLDVRFHLDRRTGRLSRILERGTRSIQMLYRVVIFTFAPTALELAFVCFVLGRTFSPLVGGLVLLTFAFYTAWSIFMTQIATDARKEVNELDNAASAKAVDALLSYETVTLFNNQALEVGQYNAYLKEYMRACITTDRLSALLNAGQAMILAVGLTTIMITALKAAGPTVSAGDLVMIQGLLLQLWAPLQFLGWVYRELRSALVDMEEFFLILRTQSNLIDGTCPLPQTPTTTPAGAAAVAVTAAVTAKQSQVATTNGKPLAAPATTSGNGVAHTINDHGSSSRASPPAREDYMTDRVYSSTSASTSVSPSNSRVAAAAAQAGLLVELEDVQFGYSPERQILRGVTLRVEPGKSLALVGPSGSGKSTVLRLLTRLYDVTGGAVRLNHMDVREIQLQSLRESVALVPQETMLFNESIMQNIRYGRPDATEEEVKDAARLAHLHDAIMRMPKGYSTVVGERGLKLSGGEKQRMAIARAFLRQPRLLICDEATSALDSATEASIMGSLAELAVGRTSIFVAHRLSTIKECDNIAVLREGRVVEIGNHEELMSHEHGLYKSMWNMQEKQERRSKLKSRKAAHRGTVAAPIVPVIPVTVSGVDSDNEDTLREGGVGDQESIAALASAHVTLQ